MTKTLYPDVFRKTDLKKQSLYKRNKIANYLHNIAEPYKSELFLEWKFTNPDKALESAKKIYSKFTKYKKQKDFIGMDAARKFLHLGFARAKYYATISSSKKYDRGGILMSPLRQGESIEKAESARRLYSYYQKASNDATYQRLRRQYITEESESA